MENWRVLDNGPPNFEVCNPHNQKSPTSFERLIEDQSGVMPTNQKCPKAKPQKTNNRKRKSNIINRLVTSSYNTRNEEIPSPDDEQSDEEEEARRS